jgi:hypothetical protein
MEVTNRAGVITRRGFLERGSAALTSVGLVGSVYAAESVPNPNSVLDSTKSTSEPLGGKLLSKNISFLPKLSTQVMQ